MRNGGRNAALRCASVAFVALLHVAALTVLLSVESLRSAVKKTAPVFVSLIAAHQPRAEQPSSPALQKAAPKKAPPRPIRNDGTSSAATTEFAVPMPIESDVAEPQVAVGLPVPVPPAAWAPKVISNIEYVRAPRLEYPAISRRLREEGRVVLRVLIGRSGRAEQVEVQTSSGSARLDEAAIKAARDALYRPYSENGEVISVWALVPALFELS